MNLSNPVIKTLITGVLSGILPVVDAAFNSPSGGTLAALSHDPVYAYLWAGAALLVHNFYTSFEAGNSGSSTTSTPQSK